jgi:hypothetical protein
MTQISLIKGSDLKLKLKRKRILSVDICRDLGYNENTVSRYFKNKMAMPAKFIVNVAAYAGFSISDLVEGNISEYGIDTRPVAVTADDPEIKYTTTPKPKPQKSKKELITIDTSKVEAYLEELQKKIDMVQQEVIDLKKGVDIINH